MNNIGVVSDIQRYSIHDGPGIRTIVFLKGCPLKCIWCSNPECQDVNTDRMYIVSKCRQCGECIENCPVSALSVVNGQIQVDRSKCTRCYKCIDNCVSNAWRKVGKAYTAEELILEVVKDRAFFGDEGGVTLSGGDPLFQPDFAEHFLRVSHEHGINTCMETSGFADAEVFRRVLGEVDVLLMDLKHTDPEKHRLFTGVENSRILENWKTAADSGKRAVCRIPVIPGFNNSIREMEHICAFIKELGIGEANLLKYHTLGSGKYKAIQKEYDVGHMLGTEVTDAEMHEFQEIFIGNGISTIIGG